MVRVIHLFIQVNMDIRFDGKRALVTGAGRGNATRMYKIRGTLTMLTIHKQKGLSHTSDFIWPFLLDLRLLD